MHPKMPYSQEVDNACNMHNSLKPRGTNREECFCETPPHLEVQHCSRHILLGTPSPVLIFSKLACTFGNMRCCAHFQFIQSSWSTSLSRMSCKWFMWARFPPRLSTLDACLRWLISFLPQWTKSWSAKSQTLLLPSSSTSLPLIVNLAVSRQYRSPFCDEALARCSFLRLESPSHAWPIRGPTTG